jgi:hypothetical protein
MRIETLKALDARRLGGMLLYVFEVTAGQQISAICGRDGACLFRHRGGVDIMHDRHMIKRTRAGRE